MAKITRLEVQSRIGQMLADNSNITAAELRAVLVDMADSGIFDGDDVISADAMAARLQTLADTAEFIRAMGAIAPAGPFQPFDLVQRNAANDGWEKVPVTTFVPDGDSVQYYDPNRVPRSYTAAQLLAWMGINPAAVLTDQQAALIASALQPEDLVAAPIATGADVAAGANTTLLVNPKAVADANLYVAAPVAGGVIDTSALTPSLSYSASITAAVTIGTGCWTNIKLGDVVRLDITNDATGREITFGTGVRLPTGSPGTYAVANSTAAFLLSRGPNNNMRCTPAGIFV